ncbi:MAG: Ig-like domain-containing protein [Thermodesulfovibrionales bacterium]|jgi:hypothetical protein
MKKITLSFIALLILSTFFINCGGGSGGSSSPGGEKPGVPEIVQVLPSHYIAMTNSAILIRAKILNGNGGPVKNLPVTFTNISPIGTMMNINDVLLGNKAVVKTDDSGMATIKVKSTTTGFVTVQAEVNKGVGIVRDRKTMFFSSSLSLSPFMSLDADGNNNGTYNEPDDYTLFQNNNANDNQVLFRATVFSKFGQRVFGSTVQFGADFPYKVGSSTTCSDGTTSCSVTFPNGNTATTNSNGEAFVSVLVDPTLHNITTILNITAVAGNGAAMVYSLFLEPITISAVTVTANPSVVAPAGTAAISAGVRLNTGAPAPDGSAVGFIADCGTVTPFALTTSGLATATFTAPSIVPSPPTCRVTATVAGVSNFADITISSPLLIIPGSQSVVAPNKVSFTVSGGTPGASGYIVTSTDPSSACNSTDADCVDPTDSGIWNLAVSGPFTVTVPATAVAGDITLNVFDSLGATKSATLTIVSGGAAAGITINPASISVTGMSDATDNVTFTITGGTSPYTAFSSNTAVASIVTTTATSFTVDPKVVAASSAATLTVVDSLGANKTATITVTPATSSLGINPSTLAVTTGTNNIAFSIIGGVSPYTIYSSNASVVSLDGGGGTGPYVIAGTSFTADAVGPGNATITIVDSDSKQVSATITVAGAVLDTTAPTVLWTIPVNGDTNVPVDGNITIRFSEDMDQTTVSAASITLFDDTAGVAYVSGCTPFVSYSSATFTATLNLNAGACNDLAVSNDYTVTVTTNVRDLAGNPLAAPYSFSFKTAP